MEGSYNPGHPGALAHSIRRRLTFLAGGGSGLRRPQQQTCWRGAVANPGRERTSAAGWPPCFGPGRWR